MKMQLKQKNKAATGGFFFFFVLLMITNVLHAQLITGRTRDVKTKDNIPFVSIALFDASMEKILSGTTSDEEGLFSLAWERTDSIKIRVSAIGYETLIVDGVMVEGKELPLGNIDLVPATYGLEGVTVEAGRVRAQVDGGNTSYLVNRNMDNASHTGVDILKLIPGVQVDVMQNISLEGKNNIVIYVNGREYDKSFLNQLNASQIDKVEIINQPSAQYDGSAEGVINIVLKKDSATGLQGHLYGEIPLSSSEIFSFPSYSINYNRGKFNFFTSYNGEFRYFDVDEKYQRTYDTRSGEQQIQSSQLVRQQNWSHKFYYGMDYHINSKNQLNFYGFLNPYSQEFNGVSELMKTGSDPLEWNAEKKENDRNLAGLFSVYYKHKLNESSGHEFSVDAGYYEMNGSNTVRFVDDENGHDLVNHVNPGHQEITAKMDYVLPFSENIRLTAGGQTRYRQLSYGDDGNSEYENQTGALYASLQFVTGKTELQTGVRYEHSLSSAAGEGFSQKFNKLLPTLAVFHKLSDQGSLKLTGRSFVNYPAFYHLNTSVVWDDPFFKRTGNAQLNTSTGYSAELEYTHRFENHFVSTRLFYLQNTDVISNLMVLDSDGVFENTLHNSGDVARAGIQLSGAFSIGKRGGLQPFIRIFQVSTSPNAKAMEAGVESRRQMAVASGLSAYYTLGGGFTSSVVVQYNSPVNNIQDNYFEGTQYFVSLEKDLGKGFKVGAVSAVPFTGKLTYQGSEIDATDFSSNYRGQILTSQVPFWLKISYNFSAGETRKRIERNVEEPVSKSKKGF